MKELTDMEVRVFGFDVLSKVLGAVNAERFIALTLRDPQDYTAWRERNLRVDESVHDVAERARAASRKFDEMHGDYTKWRAEHIDNPNETLEELAAKAKEAGEIVRLRERVLDMGDARRPKARSAKKKESSRHRRAAPAVPAQT